MHRGSRAIIYGEKFNLRARYRVLTYRLSRIALGKVQQVCGWRIPRLPSWPLSRFQSFSGWRASFRTSWRPGWRILASSSSSTCTSPRCACTRWSWRHVRGLQLVLIYIKDKIHPYTVEIWIAETSEQSNFYLFAIQMPANNSLFKTWPEYWTKSSLFKPSFKQPMTWISNY